MGSALGNRVAITLPDSDASIAIVVEAAHREATDAREVLVSRHLAESTTRQGREAVLKTRTDSTAKDFEGLVTSAAGFRSEFHEKTQTTSGAIDS